MHLNLSRGERAFRILAVAGLSFASLAAFLPFILILVSSLSSEQSLIKNGYSFWPAEWSFYAYTYMASQAKTILRAYAVSIGVTAAGTGAGVLMAAMLAYPMASSRFIFRNQLSFLVFFTMIFSGGIVPSYMMYARILHINNTYLALVVPNYLMGAFNVLLVRNYYAHNIPQACIEAARMDGASEARICFRMAIPLSVPVLATIGTFSGLAYWNDWINAFYYVDKPQFYGIQNLLIRMMNNIQFLTSSANSAITGGITLQLPSNGIRMSMAVIGILPIVLVYPFLQKYLMRGVIMGAVKG
ncbi:MAG: carbohydrate ABC transporter permease [Clostridiales bacterium]|jgi:putative aldouronate transport system permease protein|nr:carbohydrate ABC transporter permease [Clostridiales bacterium]MDR2749888.1 carbohydrate ABC transporter permease [Clostridiales bacterium]